MTGDGATAEAFASSWNNLGAGSVYTPEQFEDWLAPLGRSDVEGLDVLELGCGNGSLMAHVLGWLPRHLRGIDLGDSVQSARRNLNELDGENWSVEQSDLMTYRCDGGADLVYCIGVLHHLQDPLGGFASVLANTKPGGRFHCWVYGHEGSALIRWFVEPLRRVGSRLPWWVTKYLMATPAVVPFFFYAKLLRYLPSRWVRSLPLAGYALWIAPRDFEFFRHVAFDQLVTPWTVYLRREELEQWLRADDRIAPESVYLTQRNGNSWKFGGRVKDEDAVA